MGGAELCVRVTPTVSERRNGRGSEMRKPRRGGQRECETCAIGASVSWSNRDDEREVGIRTKKEDCKYVGVGAHSCTLIDEADGEKEMER